MDTVTAYRTLIALAEERKSDLYCGLLNKDGTTATEYRVTVTKMGTKPFDWVDAYTDSSTETIEESLGSAFESIKYLIEMPGEYMETPEEIDNAGKQFDRLLNIIAALHARVSDLERPVTALEKQP